MKKKEYFLGTNHQNRYRLLNTTDKAVAPHSSTLAWKIPWMEEPGGLQSMGSLRVGHDWATSLSLSCIGEGNGNPLQCSSLETPRDGAAWWAAVSGVAQSRTRLRRLSSSSIKHHSKQRGTNYLHSWIQLRKQGYCPELVCHILSLSHTESQPCDLTSL